jgi:hypothetical protein
VLPVSWTPKTASDLIRVGSAADGGYVVAQSSVSATSYLVSMGLSDDWSFEEAFADEARCSVIVYDPSVTGAFWARNYLSRIRRLGGIRDLLPPSAYALRYLAYRRFFDGVRATHIRSGIGYDDDFTGSVSLQTAMDGILGDRCFLKVDIEGSEYRILQAIADLQQRFSGIVIEFHDVDLHRARIDSFVRELDRQTLINVHPNNGGRVDPTGDPLLLEMSWVRSDLFEPDVTGRCGDIARRLNRKNVPSYPDLELTFG